MPTRREIFDRVKRATVAVVGMNVSEARHPFTIMGSGFCIDRDGIIVTCRHVLETLMEKPVAQQIAEVSPEEKDKEQQKLGPVEMVTPFAVFYDTRQLASESRLLAIPCQFQNAMAKTDFDLAMVRVVRHPAFEAGFPYVEIEDQEIAEGDEIATCGFPLGTKLHDSLGTVTSSFTRGMVSSIIPAPGTPNEYLKGFQLDLTAAPGNSGGPVFSMESGKVFGVLSAGLGELVKTLVKAEPVHAVVTADNVAQVQTPPEELQKIIMGEE